MPSNDTIFNRIQLATETELGEICKALKIDYTKNQANIKKSKSGCIQISSLNNFTQNMFKVYSLNMKIYK